MAAALVCAVTAVVLSVSPHSSQIHLYEHFTIACPSESGTLFRRTRSKGAAEECGRSWCKCQGTICTMGPTMASYSGLYWCQNQTDCGPAANITVSEESVTLQSPMFPVNEGERVTLRCFYKESNIADPTSNFDASFFRNGTFLGECPELVLESVSEEDEGLYRCKHPTKGQSLESWLQVKPNDAPLPSVPPSSPPHPMGVPLHKWVIFGVLVLLYTCILCIGVSICCKCRARAKEKQQESERISLRRIRDA